MSGWPLESNGRPYSGVARGGAAGESATLTVSILGLINRIPCQKRLGRQQVLTSPPLASQHQPFEGSGALVAALTADFAPRRRSELVQEASLATSEASLQGGQSKMLSGGRLRRGCAIAGTVRRGRSSARSEP